ncbi:TolB family protein [Synoicihabitans lomoniglobus]|uniref:Biopolymer transporter TolR n=1 Tax=Synoicihabitans lomoniglobus TaxID=2909285 RepID=A0AAE9ZWB4_9BACT|nr:biopolymer transporter TolR [Opitutaceae bacterium LMO-M01]WED64374.1 biopolymer transporter TolR [Opitutaceae bacterium LMO-M01]
MTSPLLRPRSLLMCALVSSTGLFAGSTPHGTHSAYGPAVGDFAHHGDVGAPAIRGNTTYDAMTQSYHMSGSGTNLWGGEDEFQFAWNHLEGDFILRARVKFLGEGVDPHRKLGWMVRSDLDTGSTYADGTVHGDGLTSLQYRAAKNGETDQIILENELDGTYPDVIQLERWGDKFIFSAARYGEPFKSVELAEIDVPNVVYAGLFLCSHNAEVTEQAIFTDVRIIKPAASDFRPYRDYIGSTLEILDVFSGELTAIHSSAESFEAPNWTTDGQKLIVNVSGNGPAKGVLRTFDLATRRIETLDTGPQINNNNDHVLTFDGSMLAISNHVGEARTSTVFTLPSTGSSEPEQITDPAWGHSFLHGWSPDNKWIVYTANRKDQWDIYKVNVDTKKEVQVTNNTDLDDGPEFSPDGEWIYFNSTRTGLMQIFRMKPDGSGQEQVFADGMQNWFPHISPDGKWMTIISYDADVVEARDHPYYKHVYLRLMPTDGSAAPKIIAYVYGGQGTINVPSWSPDGRKIAFVSNSDIK